ncbi:MAG TPA: hypothetical protein VH394_30880, partial [Thermoanaerobaculia bacterium]|nr:hypothetical protein [Thermoanaerobaculia bacterium]
MAEALPVEIVSREHLDAELIVLGAFEGEAPELDGISEDVQAAVRRLAGRPGWTGRDEQSAQTDLSIGGGDGPAIALCGLGRRDDFSPVRMAGWIARSAELAKSNGFRHALFVPPRHAETEGQAAAERAVRLMALCA